MTSRAATYALSTAAAQGFLAPRLIAAAAVPEAAEGQAVSWVQLLKTGEFQHSAYGRFTVDDAFLRDIVATFSTFAQGVPMDYDHSFLTDGSTRAAGWVRKLEIRGNELWGEVAWTAAAAAAIRDGEYRFISPEFTSVWVDETGKKHGPALLASALTNRPFLEGMREVSLSHAIDADGDRILLMKPAQQGATNQGARAVDRDQMIQAMGLATDATDEQIIAAARARRALPDGAVVLSAKDHQALTDRAEAGDKAKAEAVARVKELHLSTWVSTGRLAPADRDMISLAYDADHEKVVAMMDARQPNPAFKPAGKDGEHGKDYESGMSRAQKIDSRAKALQAATPGMTYETALRQVYSSVPAE